MKSPFVSRERVEDLQRQLSASEAERARLLDLLLTRPITSVIEDAPRAVAKEDEGSPIPFTTPFDRVLTRFDRAHKPGAVDQQFKARMR